MLIQKLTFTAADTCLLTLEDGTTVELDVLSVTQNRLCEGDDIDEALLAELKLQTEHQKARKAASRLLSTRMKTEKQLHQWLLSKGYSEAATQRALEDVKSWGYINDAEYAKAFIEYRLAASKKSWKAILWELRREGVSSDHIDQALENMEPDEDARALAVSARILGTKRDERSLEKLKNALLRYGFPWDSVYAALNHYRDEDDF